MVKAMTKGTFRQTNLPNESAEYLAKREDLRLAEIELMQQQERVAGLRRRLPQGPVIENYSFEEGPSDLAIGDVPVRTIRLSDLFTSPGRPLVAYHFMYGKRQTDPCPMCTLIIDSLNGVAQHLAQNVDLVIVAAAEPKDFRTHARGRGWTRVRLLSCGSNTFKYDLGSEDSDGNQDSTLSVFTQDSDGSVRHFYSAHPCMSEEIMERGLDLLSPVYHVLDLTPQGRGDWYAKLAYPLKSHA